MTHVRYYCKLVEQFEHLSTMYWKFCMSNRQHRQQTRVKMAQQSVTASLFEQQVFFWDVSRFGLRNEFRLSLRCRWSSTACCNLSWLHTRWWFSLVPDPIIHATWSVLFKEDGVFLGVDHDVENVIKRIGNQRAGRTNLR